MNDQDLGELKSVCIQLTGRMGFCLQNPQKKKKLKNKLLLLKKDTLVCLYIIF